MNIRRPSAYRALLALAALAPLAACGGSGNDTMRSFGLTRDAPDEFAVTTRAPLSMPPALGALPTPRPGAVRPQELNQRQQAEAALVPGAALGRGNSARGSSGENALLSAAGGQPATADIRRRVDEESLRMDRPDRGFVDSLMFWRAAEQPGVPVDPRRESRRLRENAALGRDTGEGETPIIQPTRSGNPVVRVLESIF
jgi:hypothetical protein